MVQTIDELRQMVLNVVKVKPNTDATKTQGARLRQLLNDILDSVDDLVEKQGLSISSSIMEQVEGEQDTKINALRSEINALVESMPDHSIYMTSTQVTTKLNDYVSLTVLQNKLNDYLKTVDFTIPSIDLTGYALKRDLFSGKYEDLTNKPSLFDGKYSSLSGSPTIPTLNSKFYTSAGATTNVVKKWIGKITPTVASGQVVDISSAGFTSILNIQVQVERNSSAAADLPIVVIKSSTLTQVVLNVAQNNNAVVSVAGINVLSGLPLIFATNLNTIQLHIEVTGY